MRDGQVVDMLQAMELAVCEPGHIVFEHGSTGDLFYMVLDGEVEVLIPDQEVIREYQNIVTDLKYKRD